MIGFIRGKLTAKQAPDLLIEAAGLGYEVQVPMSTYYNLPRVGEEVALYAHLVVREDAQLLYGFASEDERRLFRLLIKVSGVGAKLAITILSGISAADFADCVRHEDSARLVRLPGIGKKTADRLIVEMRDKLDATPRAPAGAVLPAADDAAPRTEAFSALVSLGYKGSEVSRMLDKIDTAQMSAEQIIREALRASVQG